MYMSNPATNQPPTALEIKAAIGPDWTGTVRGWEVQARENILEGFWGSRTYGPPILVARMPGGLWTRVR